MWFQEVGGVWTRSSIPGRWSRWPIEHREQLFLVFVNLRKAYDSVSHEVMWYVLEKHGFPEKMSSGHSMKTCQPS